MTSRLSQEQFKNQEKDSRENFIKKIQDWRFKNNQDQDSSNQDQDSRLKDSRIKRRHNQDKY